MTIITPDVSPRLKPDFLQVVHTMYAQLCNLQRDSRVLIVSDARTPEHIVATFHGMAQVFGADVATIEAGIPRGGPTYQPSAKWSPMLAAAAQKADLIVDLGVGYAQFLADAIDRGARVIMPSDGIGNPYLDDMLIRTIRDTDIHHVRREADRIAALFTNARTCKLLTGIDDELVIDIAGIAGVSGDGFLWDPDKGEFKSSYALLPPACPGIFLPRGRANGTVTVDGTVLWHQVYHEEPHLPLKLRFEDGRLTDIGGESHLAHRLRNWLRELDDPGAWEGPVHLNIGINPNALLAQNQEWERVYGAVTCGMGDMPGELFAVDGKLEWSKSRVHWDWTVIQPTVVLDEQVVAKAGRVF